MLEANIAAVTRLLAAECAKLEARRPGTGLTLSITVDQSRYSSGEVTMSLRAHWYAEGNYHDLKASSIGKLLDEVYRRLDFADRDEPAQEANNAALNAITYQPTATEE